MGNGVFGENLTTSGVDVSGAIIGERWRIGPEILLEVSIPRIPCGVFRTWMGEKGWVRRFNEAAVPGTYLRVWTPGLVRAGDAIELLHRPDHGVDAHTVFRALTLEPALLPRLLDAEELPEGVKEIARAARTSDLGVAPGQP
jgi:MOSC domain-containing protein YiiM